MANLKSARSVHSLLSPPGPIVVGLPPIGFVTAPPVYSVAQLYH